MSGAYGGSGNPMTPLWPFGVANPTVKNSTITATTTAAPASVTATPTATTAGNLLVALLAVALSAAGSMTLPAGWIVASGALGSVASIQGGIWYFPNNPGGIASVTATLTNANAAALAIYEIAGMSAGGVVQGAQASGAGGSPFSTGSTGQALSLTLAESCAVLFGLVAFSSATTLTSSGAAPAPYWQAGTTATSTTGATNLTLAPFFVLSTGQLAGPFTLAPTLAASVFNGTVMAGFLAPNSNHLQGALISGLAGVQVGGGYGSGYGVGG